jgi:hypothetical protein
MESSSFFASIAKFFKEFFSKSFRKRGGHTPAAPAISTPDKESEQESGNAVLKFLDKDNKVVNILSAKTIKNNQASSYGDISHLTRSLTQKEFDVVARITTLLLAEVINIKDGIANLLGACWEIFRVPNYPFTMQLPLFLVFSVSSLDVPSVINCRIRVRNPDNKIVLEEMINFVKLNDEVHRILHFKALTILATKTGVWTIEASSGDILLISYPITITSL